MLLCLLSVPALGEEEGTSLSPIPEGYEQVAENSRFNLYLKQDTLAIIAQSKRTGKVLYSTVQNPDEFKDNKTWKGFYQSGVVMEYIEDVKDKPIQADFINNANTITYDFSENAFTAHVSFTDLKISFDVEVKMDETGFQVRIPQSSIVEEGYVEETVTETDENGEKVTKGTGKMSLKYTVASFYLFPFLGHSILGQDEGYIIIPDGQGAIINLENNEKRYSSPYDKQVYGVNLGVDDQVYADTYVASEDIIMPVFGMVHSADEIGFLGVIDQGDISARIQAYPNGVRMSYDWVCAKYTYRLVFKQPMGPSAGTVATRTEHARQFDIVQHFLLEDGPTASYAGLAVAYRNYLISKGAFENAAHRPFDVQLDFLGIERENYILGKQDVVMTSFASAGDILSELRSEGVDRVSAVYRGWQEDGLTGGVPATNYNPAKSLGGKEGLKELRTQAEGMGIPLALEADVLSLNTETHPTLTYSAFKKITSQTWQRPTFGKVYDTLKYLTPTASRDVAKTLVEQMANGGMKNVSFTGITQLLADYYYKDAYHDTSEMAAIYAEIIDQANDKMNTTLTSPNAYLWRYANALNDMPIGGSDYTYTDAEIPFLSIALSGQIPFYAEYVNFQANTKEFFLHLMEQGARPAFLLSWEDPIELQHTNSSSIYSSRYELYRDMIITWYQDLAELHETVGNRGMIVDHVRQGDMACTTWDNGTKVYLNFGDRAATMDGVTVEKLSFKVVNGNGK